jgi:drug/metabolite transporter (DMT)-like permease
LTARAWSLFAFVSVIWGLPYLLIKVTIDEGMSPLFITWGRGICAAAVLLLLAWKAGKLGGLRGNLRWLLVYALIEITLPFPMIALGEQYVDSSIAAIMIATSPLLMALIVLRYEPSERVDGKRMIGLLIGLAGVAALVGIDAAGTTKELLGVGALLIASLGYAIGPLVLNRRLMHIDARATMGAASLASIIVLTLPTLLFASSPTITAKGLGSLVLLGSVLTAGGLVGYMLLVKEIGPSRTSVVAYINPVVAVAAGMIFLHERPGPGAVAGLLLILAGSWLATDGRLPPGLRSILRRRADPLRTE